MLTVGNRDGRKVLGFGGEMDDTELEEGEACSYRDDDLTVDPDVSLAYLDEKLQNVLGHFQKDFEGGVSAENLGAKFGGYGSFLPTYQRSPVCSQTRTLKVQNHALRSPSNLQLEGGFHNITTASSASRPAHSADISNTRTLSATKRLTTRDPLKLDAGLERSQAEEPTSRAKTSKKSTVPDQKKLRVRIRVGSDNLSTQTKAELYSGLGLVASPSSSFEASPESEGWSREPHDAPDESPNSIIHIMTSFPLEGSRVLSPLTEDLAYGAYLIENTRSQTGHPYSASRTEARKSLNLANGPTSRNNGKSSVPKNIKSSTISGMPSELSNGGIKDVPDIFSKLSKEAGDETFGCENMISKALKLPLLSTSDCTAAASDLPKNNGKMSEIIMGANKAAVSLQLSKVEPSDMVVNRADVWADEKPATAVSLDRNLLEDHADMGDTKARPKKSSIRRGGKNYESSFSELNPSEVAKTVEQELINYPTLKTDMKEGYQESEVLTATKNHSSSNAKSKLKATLRHDIAAEVVKGKAKDGSSSRSKFEKSKGERAENSKNDIRKSRDTYKDIFRDLKLEREEKELQSLDYSCGPKDSKVADICKTTLRNNMKEETVSKKNEKPKMSESHSKTGSHAAPHVSHAVPDAPAPAAPVLIEEHWVCCDSCQKWRLLPVGRLPESLPEKWLCSMLDWLPEMNRCDIEEEETTKALVSFYQASVPESNMSPLGHIGGSTYGALPSADVAGRTKNLQSAVRSRNLNDANHSPSVTNLHNPHLKKSNDLAVEKNKRLSKDEQKLLEHSSEGGGTINVKMNKRKRAGQVSPRASKKYKNEDPNDEGSLSQTEHQVASRNGDPYARSISPFLVTSRAHIEYTQVIPYKNHQVEEINNLNYSKKSKERVNRSVDGSSGKRKDGAKDSSTKKRKANGSQESRHSESLPSAGVKSEERKGSLKEDSSQRFASEEKKARVSSHLSGLNRESNTERGYLAVPSDLKLAQDPDSISFKGSMEDIDPSRRDLAPAHPFMEATSSSSKISSSRKSKANLQDTKGSPVESVSSSPLRSQSKASHACNGRRAFDKECPPNGLRLSASPRRYSNHEVDGRNGSTRLVKMDDGRMGEASVFSHKGKLSSVLDFRDGVSGGNSVSCDDLLDKRTVTKVANTSDKYPRKEQISDLGPYEEACNNTHSLPNVSLPDKKGSSMRSNDRKWRSKSGSDKNDASNLFGSSQDQTHTHGNKLIADGLCEHTAAKPQKLERKHDLKIQSENGREGTKVESGTDGMQDAKHDIFPSLSASRKILVEELEETPNTFPSEKVDLLETSLLAGKSDVRSPFIGGISSENGHSHIGNEIDSTSADASRGDNSFKGLESFKNANNTNGVLPTILKHSPPIGHSSKDLSASSPARRDSSSQSAANAIKEARSLKHVADRLKSSGSNGESIGLYFQAALKFLLGASLLESSTSETRHGDMIQSTQMYSSTAELCEFCAREFEKAQDMASAALAYKCTEVAYMRVVYSSHANANRDRHELQTALQMAPPGESPSSSASDVDNLNNAATGDKVLVAKGVSSPQLASSHVVSARSRPSFSRLLNFAQDVNFAMEASRKSRLALAAASAKLEKVQNEDGIVLIKRALDYNFQDVEGLLQLVRLGVEASSR